MTATPLGKPGLLANCLDLIAPQHVVVIETADADQSAKLARSMFKLSLPGAVQQIVDADQLPASGPLAGKTAVDGQPTAYACLGPTCSLPVAEHRRAARAAEGTAYSRTLSTLPPRVIQNLSALCRR